MTIPGWLLSRPAIYAYAAVAVLGAGGLWWHAHDARVRREAVTAERIADLEDAIERQDSVIGVRDSALVEARQHTDTVRVAVQAGVAAYAHQRAGINTLAPQPPGVPAGSVVVPISFVVAADSLARLVPQLVAQMALERAASERRIAASDSAYGLARLEIVELKIAVKAARPGLSGKIKYAAIGAAIAAVGFAALRR